MTRTGTGWRRHGFADRKVSGVNPTTQAFLAAILGAVVAGSGIFAWHLSQLQLRRAPVVEEPSVPPQVATVLSVLRSSAVVVDDEDKVVKASAPAYALGIVRGTELVVDDLATLVREVRRDGQIRETELVLSYPGGPERHVVARVAPLGTRLVLALLEDRTRERHVEAVRRDFVANVSHELKTPVGAIRVLAEAVTEASDDPEAVERFASRMVVESERLTEMVQQIIELSRLQGDNQLDLPTAVSIDAVIENAIDVVGVDAEQKHIRITSAGRTRLEVTGNEGQVMTAVTNLIANAVHYSDPGSAVTIMTAVHPTPTGGRMVAISVVDQGIGIPNEELGRIFERFYRVDPARHRSTGGTGLGLSIVKHVAASHGGEVSVWSEEGHGSTFTLSLPEYVDPQSQPQ